MANAQKYTRAACGHLAAHYERRKDEKGEYVKFGNQDIDPQKTHLNYNLAPRRGVEQIDFIRQRTTEARTLKRDDVNVVARSQTLKPWFAVWVRLSVRSCQRSMLLSRSQSVIGSSHLRSRSLNQGIWNAKESGFWGILAETTGRETQVSCSVGVDGIAQKIQKSRAVRGGDLRKQILPRPLSSG